MEDLDRDRPAVPQIPAPVDTVEVALPDRLPDFITAAYHRERRRSRSTRVRYSRFGSHLLIALVQLSPLRLQDLPNAWIAHERIPEAVVIEPRSHKRPGGDGAPQQEILEGLERPVIDQLLAPT